jgi:two-component system, LytTR family, response regulator
MRLLVIDDEPLAHKALASLLSARSDVEHFDSALDAVDAFEKLAKNSYDVILLDINMPEISGIELLDRLTQMGHSVPSVVFVTAHSKYAITAFEKHAVDYVLKPFASERMHEALNRAFHRTETERAAQIIEVLPQLKELSQRRSGKIAIKTKGRIIFIDPADVVAVQAEGNYVLLQKESGSYLLRESISVIAEKLSSYGFVRIHRSVLINTAFVESIEPWLTGEYGLRLKGGKEYTVTRTYKKNLRSLAQFWLGTESFS